MKWLAGRLRHGHCWFVRHGLDDTLNTRVLPLLGATPYEMERVLDEADQRRLRAAYPVSTEAAELARALRATAELYDLAVDRWAERTGEQRPASPLEPAIRARLADLCPLPRGGRKA